MIGRLKTNESIDCRSDWVEVHSMFGLCKQFVPTGPKWKGRFYDSSTMTYKLWLIEVMAKPWKNAKAKTTFGRKSAISIVASYNQTDWTSGWNHFIQGCTIFINPEFELTLVSGSSIQNELKWPISPVRQFWTSWLDPDDSVILSPGTLPILSVRQKKLKKLGTPYSQCIEVRFKIDEHDSLNY